MKAFQISLAVTLAVLFFLSSSDAACICNTSTPGTYCGQSSYVTGCIHEVVYKCNGVYGSQGYYYARCRRGCVHGSMSNDHCLR
ncbi:hypothetical protein BCR41DRAFT_360013 [Lobosporangium transversale]|uniref:CBM1 domain-containing protein n=1 Tax=Lobosporangium transversale TaxID=64571 RepID=A0A1Y2GF53_9FUNG|nr:hypothetical protein BCR41DRAFT_360013 [Lobosporangium transversale]ORZ07763.1 hypothetical protein BCR41DRAFT_360013 [Lobosporangium transversale]|eukprot:XP_021878129.1 hypothetical protein BCR41DRAFT_360013 [Lobosporangium transversale]